MIFTPTVEHVKEEINSYADPDAMRKELSNDQANLILNEYYDSLQQHFCDFINSLIIDGELEEILEEIK